jgi:hypothetical protein
MPSRARRIEVIRDALKRGYHVRVGHTYCVVYSPKFKVQTDKDFVRMVTKMRHGRSTFPRARHATFIVTPDILEAAHGHR